jgi:alkylation response protein AidB-like acyl-CoA dehydrogenase
MAARHDAGYAGINWPTEMGGQGLGHLEKITFEAEEMQFGMPSGYFGISLGMPIPIMMRYCEDKAFVKERVIKALRGEEIWCQLFSEPSAGSDLAALRLRAEQEGNGWKLNGQKLWTSWAQYCDYGVIVARSDPTVAKHKGLTYFWVDMRAPGVTVRPVKLAGGDSHVNEVFFDDVKLDDSHRLSPIGGGFGVAMTTLMIERYIATDSAGFGPHLDLFVNLAKEIDVNGKPAIEDGRVRSAIARNYAMRNALDAITARAMKMMQAGMEPGPEGSLQKLVAVRSRQKLSELALDLMGTDAFHFDEHAYVKENWQTSWINAPTGRIAGGSDETLLNNIAERILGLPQDHRPDKGIPFNQIPA